MIFFLGYNKIAKKQKFSPLDIVESRSKEMWSLILNLDDRYFLILDVSTLKLTSIIILSTERPETILPTARTTKN